MACSPAPESVTKRPIIDVSCDGSKKFYYWDKVSLAAAIP